MLAARKPPSALVMRVKVIMLPTASVVREPQLIKDTPTAVDIAAVATKAYPTMPKLQS